MTRHVQSELEKMDLPEAALEIIASLQSLVDDQEQRAEVAEQERDQLKEKINLAMGVLNMMQPGRFDKQTIIEMLERIIREESKPDAPPEWENQIEMYLLTHPARDTLQLKVVNNVNLPNNPDFETLVEEWIVDNYGSLDDWEYHRLSHTEIIAIGADKDVSQKG